MKTIRVLPQKELNKTTIEYYLKQALALRLIQKL